jgi:hypothetical protein
VMTPEGRQVLRERLSEALQRGMITVELVNQLPGQPYRWVAKEHASEPTITARVRDYVATDGAWLYWWLWRQPIESVDDLGRVVDRFCDVVLAVEGRT